ncbi:unnamed protein product [Scytosiphon promiscuus]
MADGKNRCERKDAISTSSCLDGMRRSCDACGRKKKRCDGHHPCSRCARSADHCEYSKRQWHHKGRTTHRNRRQPRSSRDAPHVGKDSVRSILDALVERRMLPLKRCRLRASPATGLVGMHENAFISDFFGCVGFLPLTNESQIREAMVKIMMHDPPRRERGFGTDYHGEEGALDALEGRGDFGHVPGIDQLPIDPSFCPFWCAVALGALAKGCPIESVNRYSQLAEEAFVARCSDSTHAELAKASAILTYLHSSMGNADKFRESLERSESFLRAAIEQGATDIHPGLPDLILHCRRIKNVLNSTLGSAWAQKQAPPQLQEISTEDELYCFVVKSIRAFYDAVHVKVQEQCRAAVQDLYSAGPGIGDSPASHPQSKEWAAAMGAVMDEGNYPEFEPLQETADSPRIRAGIGSLIINSPLVFVKAATGDLNATLQRLYRSVEVFERYPGLCRCMMESHLSHMILAALAGIDDSRARGMYDRLRRTHNLYGPPHSLPIPPLDEWEGIGAICSNLNCRVMEDLMKSKHMKVFRTPPVDSFDKRAVSRKANRNQHGDTLSDVLHTGSTHRETVDFLRDTPTSNWTLFNAESKHAQDHRSASTGCTNTVQAPQAFPYRTGPSDRGFSSQCSVTAVDTRATEEVLTRPTEIDDHLQVIAEPEEEEIAAADWLEVADAYRM